MNKETAKEFDEITTLTYRLHADTMTTWTDEKRKDFVSKFNERVRASRYILLTTAERIQGKALETHFISTKHIGKNNFGGDKLPLLDHMQGKKEEYTLYYHGNSGYKVGGRLTTELDEIANERADAILSSLPELKAAVKIISPEISKTIEDREKLLEKAKVLFEKVDELGGPLSMADVDQNMTVAKFREYVKERNKQRREGLVKLDEIGQEAEELEHKVNKFLYSGLPGLSQAVVDIITNLSEKSTAMGSMERRVEEKVVFGDSNAALTLLEGFERDEVTVSSDVKAQFDKALDLLKLAGAKKLKLKKGK